MLGWVPSTVRTLVDASRGLGAPWRVVFVRVIAPNIRSAIFGSIFLTLALVLGEYTMAALYALEYIPNMDCIGRATRSNSCRSAFDI